MSSTVVSQSDLAQWGHDPELLGAVMTPYRAHCRYLVRADVVAVGDLTTGERVTMRCDFEIPESCYIDDTGHFNAVEFNICYNQMLYYVVAKLIKESRTAPFDGWTLDDFWRRQLSQFLIADFHSTFRRSIRGRQLSGEIALTKAVQRGNTGTWNSLLLLYSECSFWDDGGPASSGRVKVVVLDPPRPGGEE